MYEKGSLCLLSYALYYIIMKYNFVRQEFIYSLYFLCEMTTKNVTQFTTTNDL